MNELLEETGRAVGPVVECPDLVLLERAPLAPEIHGHVELCESCQLALELMASSFEAARECERIEPLLAARNDGTLGRAAANLLARHLARCDDCRAVAETLAPTADLDGDQAALPQVDPASYALGLEIGRGGMGVVISARDLRIGRPVAVKELRYKSSQLAARFEREARVTARLQHPGIVPIYEIGRWPDGTPFYSMRMVDGSTLHAAIAGATTLAARLALLPAVITATEAVAFAHAQRIIHRDLTPANVLVGAYGETLVIDWGLAKDMAEVEQPSAGPYRGDDAAAGLTSAGAVIGTAAYMPPEQANAQPVDERADVYALGAILYHLLAGAPPYRSIPAAERLAAVQAGPPTPIDEVAPAAPADLVSIVTKAMARDPHARYPSARELAEELKAFQAGRLVQAHEYTNLERMRRFVVRNRAPVTVTAIALLVLGVLGFVAIRRVLRERTAARNTVASLLEEEGRGELVAGDPQRALAYFEAAYASGIEHDPALRFMRATALREIATVRADLDCGGVVEELSFSPDGALLVASCHDLAKVWRMADLSPVATLGPAKNGFQHLQYSSDHKRLVTWGGDGRARMWDATSFQLVRTFVHGDTTITFATFRADDTRLATTGYDGFAKIWNVETGEPVLTIRGSDAVFLKHLYGRFNGDGKRLLTFTIEGIGAGWNADTGEKIGEVQHGSFGLGGDVAPDGSLATTCGLNGLVKLWDTSSPHLVMQLAGATDAVIACKFSADGTRVLGTSYDGHAYAWDVASGAMIAAVDHGSSVWTGHFSRGDDRMVTVGFGDTVKLWDLTTGGLIATHDTQGGSEAEVSPDGKWLIVGRGDGSIRMWSIPPRVDYREQRGEAIVAVTSDGSRAAVTTAAGWIQIRDTETRATIATPPLVPPIVAVGDRFIATSASGELVAIDARTGSTVASVALARPPHELAASGNGRRVVVGLGDASEVWDLDGRAAIAQLPGVIHALASDDGRFVLGWAEQGRPRVWQLDSARPAIELAIEAPLQPVGFSHGGRRIVIQREHSVEVWSATTGQRETSIDDLQGAPTLDPSGRYVTTIVAYHNVQILDLDDDTVTGFAAPALQQAQIDPSGQLVAAIDRFGAELLVLGAHDGRILSRWSIAHDRPAITQDGLTAPTATVSWSRDGKTILARSQGFAHWNVDPELGEAALSPTVRRHMPWQVVDAKLVPALAAVHGVVKRGDSPVANATLELVFRQPADLGVGSITRAATEYQNKQLAPFSTGPTGEFERDRLAPGKYALTVTTDGAPPWTKDIVIDIENEAMTIDLGRSQSP